MLTLAGTGPTDPALTPGSPWSEADISGGVQAPEVRESKQVCAHMHKAGPNERECKEPQFTLCLKSRVEATRIFDLLLKVNVNQGL